MDVSVVVLESYLITLVNGGESIEKFNIEVHDNGRYERATEGFSESYIEEEH